MNIFYWLLAFVPVSIALEYWHFSVGWVLLTACLAILPLSALMGKATEELAHFTGPRIGGFLNGTFGNAVELIITLIAIKKGLFEMVKASITGSILGNLLLVLGFALLYGGIKHREQSFNQQAAGVNSTMLALAVAGLVIPAVFMYSAHQPHSDRAVQLSIGVAVALFLVYLAALFFSLVTHREILAPVCEVEEENEPCWSLRKSITILAGATVLVAVTSEVLVSALEEVIATWHWSELFVGVILVPIVGNAAEHFSAVLMAGKNRMDAALEIAVGSSIQIALFVAPVLVFASLIFGRPMDLIFQPFELAALAVSITIVNLISLDGKSNWLEGVQLLVTYIVMALAFYFLPTA
ncbi:MULTISPECIES: calcium/proton exchanger [unclassified Carboxydocella]|uniref:calcium/proton exchanger n=1 Tax=unclassified Carboxydocella TaxID=2685367 RepID=UPI0009ABF4D9|nr:MULTISPECIES: calcium/proton exchanger [unclassified Carboxydocella]GAW29981.1 calcium/proton exchanger [Carboxydocella sp. ULO1]GAW30416.1 calcium/proton exchanger [Carboxydocella sp. JDF658]